MQPLHFHCKVYVLDKRNYAVYSLPSRRRPFLFLKFDLEFVLILFRVIYILCPLSHLIHSIINSKQIIQYLYFTQITITFNHCLSVF